MSYYGFEYFCGANVVVSVKGMPLFEVAGIQYEGQDSKRPIFGYSSRHYDAVSAGQVLISGTLLVNYVHQDYLFRAIEVASGVGNAPPPTAPVSATDVDLSAFAGDYERQTAFADTMDSQYWNQGLTTSNFSPVNNSHNPFDISGGVDITVTFGQQGTGKPAGKTSLRLTDVHFTGRSKAIRIDEDVIVEAYDFFARDIISLRNRPAGLSPGPTTSTR